MAPATRKSGVQIGDIARRAGLSPRAVRYYEELGLIRPESHSEGGFRLYGEESLRCLLLINRLKGLGLSLHEIGDILQGQDGGSDQEAVGGLMEVLRDRLRQVDAKIAELRRMQSDLRETLGILEHCRTCDRDVLLDAGPCRECGWVRQQPQLPHVFEVLLLTRRGGGAKAPAEERPPRA
ncbi:MAG: MerR family transcriptional regulator [Acidobacteriota bacterium]